MLQASCNQASLQKKGTVHQMIYPELSAQKFTKGTHTVHTH